MSGLFYGAVGNLSRPFPTRLHQLQRLKTGVSSHVDWLLTQVQSRLHHRARAASVGMDWAGWAILSERRWRGGGARIFDRDLRRPSQCGVGLILRNVSLQNATSRITTPEGRGAMKPIDKHAMLKKIAQRDRSFGRLPVPRA